MKSVYDITRAEYQAVHGKPRRNTTLTGRCDTHMLWVETLLNRDPELVSERVLYDYEITSRGIKVKECKNETY